MSRPEDVSEQTPAKKSCLSEGSFLTSSCIIALLDLLSCALPWSCSGGDLAIPWVGLQEGDPQQDPAADEP